MHGVKKWHAEFQINLRGFFSFNFLIFKQLISKCTKIMVFILKHREIYPIVRILYLSYWALRQKPAVPQKL